MSQTYTYTNQQGLYRVLRNCLLATLVVSIICDVLSFVVINLALDPTGAKLQQAQMLEEGLVQNMAIAYLVFYLITVIVFSKWIIRSHKNIRALGAEGFSFSPGWAVGYFFIPLINLYRPYQAMKELWQASCCSPDWDQRENLSLVRGWWGLWLAVAVIQQVIMRLEMRASSLEHWKMLQIIYVFSIISWIALTIVTLRMTSKINAGIISRGPESPETPNSIELEGQFAQ